MIVSLAFFALFFLVGLTVRWIPGPLPGPLPFSGGETDQLQTIRSIVEPRTESERMDEELVSRLEENLRRLMEEERIYMRSDSFDSVRPEPAIS